MPYYQLPVSVQYPYYIVYDGLGSLYISDPFNSNITKMTTTGQVQAFKPTLPFDRPYGLAMDSSGFLYVADSFNNRIVKLTPNGTAVAVFTTTSPALNLPNGVAIHPLTQHMWISDTYNQRVVELAANGTQLSVFNVGYLGLSYDLAVAFDSEGSMYVADSEIEQIVKRFTNGTAVIFYSGLTWLVDVALDALGQCIHHGQ